MESRFIKSVHSYFEVIKKYHSLIIHSLKYISLIVKITGMYKFREV